jgi:DNA-binding transcriptional ArsR family regulator
LCGYSYIQISEGPAEEGVSLVASGRKTQSLAHDGKAAEARSQILKALGNPGRLRIISYLCDEGEKTVAEIGVGLDLPQAVVSQHLASLRLHGLVQVRSEGGHRHYSIAVPEIRKLVKCLDRCRRTLPGG